MANFPQSKLGAPNVDWLSWYLEFITAKGRNIAAILGHPDPREGKRGPAGDGGVGDDTDADLAQEQNELLFRGLAKLRQNFVLQVLAEHIGRDRMTQTLLRVSEVASNVASRRKGTIGIGFNLGIPLMAAIGQSRMEGLGAGHGTSESVQDGASHGWGNTHAVGKAHAEGTTVTNGTSETFGESDTTAKGTSHGTMHSTMESRMESSSRGSGSSSGGGTMSGWGWNVGFGAEPIGIGVKGNFGHNWGSSSFSAVGIPAGKPTAYRTAHRR